MLYQAFVVAGVLPWDFMKLPMRERQLLYIFLEYNIENGGKGCPFMQSKKTVT